MEDEKLWWRDGVIYQIYPRSFSDTNGDGIGDLNGIRARLDYLADLGIDAIWLSPIYPSPDADFGYDISDYTAIDPRFGSIDEYDLLVKEAHQRGIRVILDLVLNHTSDQHPWFLESRSSRDNPKRDWYIWRPPNPRGSGRRPNNWQSVFGGPGWEFDPHTGEYYFHMFVKEQPDLNWRNPDVRQAILDVARFWLDRGTDGFRLDVFNAYFKHPGFFDNPPAVGIRGFDRQKHLYDIDQPEMAEFLCELRTLVDSYPERYLVGETFLGGGEKAAHYCGPHALHAAFNFAFTESPWKPARFLKHIRQWETWLGPEKWPNYVLNNHDLPRSASRYQKGSEEDSRLKVAAALLLTLRGTPFLYYGEEIGMRDIHLSRAEILDPPGRKFWPFYKGRDGCRSPMQWNASHAGGFTTGRPWLPVHPNMAIRNVETQSQDPLSLFNFYRALLSLRRSQPALTRGNFTPLPNLPSGVLAYQRQTGQQVILVALNFSSRPQHLSIPPDSLTSGSPHRMLLSTHREKGAELTGDVLELFPFEACLLA